MTTPRLELNTYERGAEGWTHNDTVRLLDELAIDKGNISERPSSGEYDDEMYYAIDQGILWGWDNAQNDWTARGGVGSASDSLPFIFTNQISGGVVNRTQAIDNLPGNIYVTESTASDPTQNDGDLWFKYQL